MKRYDFIKPLAKVRWNDPAIGDFEPKERQARLELNWTVTGFPADGVIEDDSILLIKSEEGSEAEVYAGELEPAEGYPVCLDSRDLAFLSEVFHEYKDCFRGDKEAVIRAMFLEIKLREQTGGAYVSDTTYDVNSKDK